MRGRGESGKQAALVDSDGPTAEQREDADSARLVARFQAGEAEEAFAALYSRYVDRVYAYLRIALHSRHEAEDVAQQVFTKAFEALPRYRQRGRSFEAWLFTIVRNAAISHLRKHGRIEPEDPQELDRLRENGDTDPALSLARFTDQDLTLFIERLSLPQRQVLVLRYMLDLSLAETAQVLDRTESDVSVLQSRATAYLRKRLRAIGKKPTRATETQGTPMRTLTTPAQVLRHRRFALLNR